MSDGLLPGVDPDGSIVVDRQIPACARQWGRIVDTSQLLPGDLILTRPVKPDALSIRIADAQRRGGLPSRHAQWTHVAVYLGDGETICEASFKEPGYKWGVNIRSLFHYCNEEYALRARRPAGLNDQQRIGVAIGAMHRVGSGYNFGEIITFWKASLSGKGFWQGNIRQRIDRSALVCSTLYQDAYNFSFRGNTVRMGSLCTPAHLSASTDFELADVPLRWLAIW